MDATPEALPDDVDALKAALAAERRQRLEDTARIEAELAVARAKASDDQALIAHQQLQIEKLRRQLYGQRSERAARLLDQMELSFEELEGTAAEDEVAAEAAVARTTAVAAFTRKRPARRPFPEHLPRERVVEPGPTACSCCGSDRLRKLGEDVTETLEVVPRQWKVIQHVREKFTCRDCERISQAPAPFHVIARGWAGPSLLAMILFEKFGQHQPLNRQAERYAREGVPLNLSTLADQVGACCVVLAPLIRRIEAHVFAAERLHGDDTTVPVLAKGQDRYRAVLGLCARRPAVRRTGSASGDVLLFARSDRRTSPGPPSRLCRAVPGRRLRRLHQAVRARPIERSINGQSAEQRRAVRQEVSAPLVAELEGWMREQRARLSRGNDLARAIDYMLKRWPAFTRFLDDGRICLSNNAAERALRGIALGRKSWLFAGSDRGGQRAAAMYSLIVTAKMNDVDPQAWLADVLARIAGHPASKIDELLPWHWRPAPRSQAA